MTKPTLSELKSTVTGGVAPELLPFHPSANVFDLMEGEEFNELVADIKRRGLRIPIVTHKGQIIDGRNRARACVKAGVPPRYQEFNGSDEDVDRYIISMNIHRRHLAANVRRDALVKLLKLHPEKSDRAIAEGPVLDQYTVGFQVMHGFSSATIVYDISQDDDGRPLIILYVGDYDPSGMFMSGEDLPNRFAKYGGNHIKLKRIALTTKQPTRLPSFPATDKRDDPRYKWFVKNYGKRCWELDAMDPNALRKCVEREIKKLIEPVAWERCEIVNEAERELLQTVIAKWGRS